MLLIFCRDPLEPHRADRSFQAEVDSAERFGLPYGLIDHDALVRGEARERVVRGLPDGVGCREAIYRGWMVTPEQYRRLFDMLAAKKIMLLNDPDAYRQCHHLPEWYPIAKELTPRSIWLTGDLSLERIMEALAAFEGAPVIVKDFVKSRKHEWHEACFIPLSSDRQHVARVVGRFLELQGESLAGGLVFRQFVEFARIGTHPQSGMPLADEYRIFWRDGSPIFSRPYWDWKGPEQQGPPLPLFPEVARSLTSRFLSMDVARCRDDRWMIVEVGDGQVSGLPKASDAVSFYEALASR